MEEAVASIHDRKAEALEAPTWEQVCEMRGEARQLAYLSNLDVITGNLLDMLTYEEDEDATV